MSSSQTKKPLYLKEAFCLLSCDAHVHHEDCAGQAPPIVNHQYWVTGQELL